jgi:hypothetical protein
MKYLLFFKFDFDEKRQVLNNVIIGNRAVGKMSFEDYEKLTNTLMDFGVDPEDIQPLRDATGKINGQDNEFPQKTVFTAKYIHEHFGW